MKKALDSQYHCGGLWTLQMLIGDWREEKGFETSWGNIKEKLLLIHSEVSEANEELRNDVFSPYFIGGNDEFKAEMADIAIRLLDICDATNIDLAYEIAKKMEKNEGRPRKHGKVY